jgi:hypothetical protein
MAKLEFESMTLAEIEQIEVLTGRNIESIMADGAPRGVALKAIIWTIRRRENANYTLEEAGKVSLKEATALFTGDDDDEKKD